MARIMHKKSHSIWIYSLWDMNFECWKKNEKWGNKHVESCVANGNKKARQKVELLSARIEAGSCLNPARAQTTPSMNSTWNMDQNHFSGNFKVFFIMFIHSYAQEQIFTKLDKPYIIRKVLQRTFTISNYFVLTILI